MMIRIVLSPGLNPIAIGFDVNQPRTLNISKGLLRTNLKQSYLCYALEFCPTCNWDSEQLGLKFKKDGSITQSHLPKGVERTY